METSGEARIALWSCALCSQTLCLSCLNEVRVVRIRVKVVRNITTD